MVFLLYLAFIDRVKDPVPRNHYIFARGAWGDVCASRRGVVFLLYLAFIDRVKDPVPRNHYIFAHSSCTLRSLRYFCTLRSLRYPAYFMCV